MKRFWIGLSVFFNVAVIVAVGWLYYVTDGFAFIRLNQERMRSLYESLPIEPGDVVFLGDSITRGGEWAELFPEVAAKNRGIGGDTTKDVLARLDTITRGRPAKIFLKIGTNDITAFVSVEEIAANVGTIIDRIHAESPETQVYVQSVLPRDSLLTGTVRELNDGLEAVAAEHDATWVDVFDVFIDTDGSSIRDDYANDELHLMGPAYVAWRDALEPHVRQRASRER